MVTIQEEVCIINHRILRYIRSRENNRKYMERRILSSIRVVGHDNLLGCYVSIT